MPSGATVAVTHLTEGPEAGHHLVGRGAAGGVGLESAAVATAVALAAAASAADVGTVRGVVVIASGVEGIFWALVPERGWLAAIASAVNRINWFGILRNFEVHKMHARKSLQAKAKLRY